MIAVAGDALSAVVNPLGAELTHLRDAHGRELMTDADPAFWTGHAPLLFPIVGALNGGVYRVDGREYALPQHGFARRREFAVVEQARGRVRLRLEDDAATRAVYPFAFALEAEYRIEGATLHMVTTITNRDARDLTASFGFHPAFAWPLPYGQPREAHVVRFAHDEPAPLRALEGGLLAGERASPLDGRLLRLSDALFADDALVWGRLESRSLTYGAEGGPQLEIGFPNMPMLGIWTKPGARFVCIEPWQGHADPKGFDGAFRDKPGVFTLAPGAQWRGAMTVTLRL